MGSSDLSEAIGKFVWFIFKIISQAVSETLPQRDNVDHLAASEQQRKENLRTAGREGMSQSSLLSKCL